MPDTYSVIGDGQSQDWSFLSGSTSTGSGHSDGGGLAAAPDSGSVVAFLGLPLWGWAAIGVAAAYLYFVRR